MTEETNGLLKRIGNDVEALIAMVGDLQIQRAGESLSTQMKFRRDQYPYQDALRADTGIRRKVIAHT